MGGIALASFPFAFLMPEMIKVYIGLTIHI